MQEEPIFHDVAFRQKRKHGTWRVVEAPVMPTRVADTHAHIHMLADPALSLARAGAHGVAFVEMIVDPTEDGTRPFEELDSWVVRAGSYAASLAASDAGVDAGAGEGAGAGADEGAGVGAGEGVLVEGAGVGAGAACARAVGGCGAQALPFAGAVPRTRIAAGVHPHNAKLYDEAAEAQLVSLLHDERVSALGEIGLDYHYDLSPRDVQQDVFRQQVRLAKEAGLPVVLHMREAHDDGFRILQEEGFPEAGTLLHCFNLDASEAARWIEAGCYLAFGGPLTFKKADEVREAARLVPLDRLLTETDAPYMTPEPMRGTTCGPEHVIWTADKLCAVRGAEDEQARRELLQAAYRNALRLLDRAPTAWQGAQA